MLGHTSSVPFVAVADDETRAGRATHWTPAIETYLRGLFAHEDDGMRDALSSIDRAGLPAIQLGPTEGRILELLLRLAGARRVVEIGTLAGMRGFHAVLAREFDAVCLPTPDGLSVGIKH